MCEKKHEDIKTETPNNSSWQADIEERDYYYDDSTGYEIFTDEDEGEGEVEEVQGS